MAWQLLFGDHPSDHVLLALAGGATVDAPVSAHVRTCRSCLRRIEEHTLAWTAVRLDATTAADAAFTPARLERQYSLIMRRLGSQGQTARVLRFPRASGAVRATRRVARRWVAAAAAAGLFVGVAAGRFVDGRPGPFPHFRGVTQVSPQAVTLAPASIGQTGHDRRPADDAWLFELDVAAAAPRIEPLRTLDALTPRLGDSAMPPR